MAVLLIGCIDAPEFDEDGLEGEESELAGWSTEELLASYPEDKQYGYVPVPASLRGWACKSACSLLIATGCAKVALACGSATVITLGQFSIPCAWAVSVACVAAPAIGGPTCDEICSE